MALTGAKIMSLESITHSLSPSLFHDLPGVDHSMPGSFSFCPCASQAIPCAVCAADEALDAALDASKETDHQEWGTW